MKNTIYTTLNIYSFLILILGVFILDIYSMNLFVILILVSLIGMTFGFIYNSHKFIYVLFIVLLTIYTNFLLNNFNNFLSSEFSITNYIKILLNDFPIILLFNTATVTLGYHLKINHLHKNISIKEHNVFILVYSLFFTSLFTPFVYNEMIPRNILSLFILVLILSIPYLLYLLISKSNGSIISFIIFTSIMSYRILLVNESISANLQNFYIHFVKIICLISVVNIFALLIKNAKHIIGISN